MMPLIQKSVKAANYRMHLVRSLIPLRSLRASVGFLLSPLLAAAEPSARLETPTTDAWTGQRISFFIELRAPGSFDGAPSFDIPRMPGSLVLKVGNPVPGSLTEAGTEYFTQRHQFALISQAEGDIELPTITARFAHKKGYTGPSFDAVEQLPSARFTIRRPPGSEHLEFLVTTESLQIEEHWDPEPGPVETGAVFKRTITQKAPEFTGIALSPAPSGEIEGIRTYVGDPEIADRIDRGTLRGERRETVTYLVREPGLHTIPAIRFDWWNPKTETLESITLPERSFSATAPPPPPPKPSPRRFVWPLLAVGLLTLLVVFRGLLLVAVLRLRDIIDPPRRRAERAFIRACRIGDPAETESCWNRLSALRPDLTVTPALASELLALHRVRFGKAVPAGSWSGDPLLGAYREASRSNARCAKPQASPLPPLNL